MLLFSFPFFCFAGQTLWNFPFYRQCFDRIIPEMLTFETIKHPCWPDALRHTHLDTNHHLLVLLIIMSPFKICGVYKGLIKRWLCASCIILVFYSPVDIIGLTRPVDIIIILGKLDQPSTHLKCNVTWHNIMELWSMVNSTVYTYQNVIPESRLRMWDKFREKWSV